MVPWCVLVSPEAGMDVGVLSKKYENIYIFVISPSPISRECLFVSVLFISVIFLENPASWNNMQIYKMLMEAI